MLSAVLLPQDFQVNFLVTIFIYSLKGKSIIHQYLFGTYILFGSFTYVHLKHLVL